MAVHPSQVFVNGLNTLYARTVTEFQAVQIKHQIQHVSRTWRPSQALRHDWAGPQLAETFLKTDIHVAMHQAWSGRAGYNPFSRMARVSSTCYVPEGDLRTNF